MAMEKALNQKSSRQIIMHRGLVSCTEKKRAVEAFQKALGPYRPYRGCPPPPRVTNYHFSFVIGRTVLILRTGPRYPETDASTRFCFRDLTETNVTKRQNNTTTQLKKLSRLTMVKSTHYHFLLLLVVHPGYLLVVFSNASGECKNTTTQTNQQTC